MLKTVKTRLKESDWDVLGDEREEIRVVPLGDVEKDMAVLVGLRRLACMGVRVSGSIHHGSQGALAFIAHISTSQLSLGADV